MNSIIYTSESWDPPPSWRDINRCIIIIIIIFLRRRAIGARTMHGRSSPCSSHIGLLLFLIQAGITVTFYRAMLCIRGTSHGPVSVRLSVSVSVCLSVTSRSSTKTVKQRITQTTPHDSPGTLVF